MPPFPGEERLITVFADIHYYFAQPTLRPSLERFDKASYFYIYYNSTRQTSRIEIANNPGTPDQDAFNGYIDTCRIINSFKFPTLVTIEVDGTPKSPTSPVSGRDHEEWCLASADPRDAHRSKHKLHTLDIYFWALEDARLVVECFKKLLPRQQLEVAELDPKSYHDEVTSSGKPVNAMSPLVQNLENMAVSDPAYNGRDQGRDRSRDQSRQTSAVSPSSSFASHRIPPPPSGGPSGGQQIHSPSPAISDMSSQPGRQSSVRSSKPQSQNFTPIAYNPAAPAAPEPIAHREKTPPPEDGGQGTGLDMAARHDRGYMPGLQQQQQQRQPQGGYQIGQGEPIQYGFGSLPPGQPSQGFSLPPAQQPTAAYSSPPPPPPSSSTAGYSSPPPQTSHSYTHSDPRSSATSTTAAPSFGPGAASTIAQRQQPPLGQIQGAAPDHQYSLAAEQYTPHTPSSGAPALTPGAQFYSTIPQPAKPLAHVQPQYADYLSSGSTPVQPSFSPAQNTGSPQQPIGGYSKYDYRTGSGQGQGQQGANPYDVHQQVYRPTEAEAGSHGHKKPSRTNTGDGRKASTAERAEKKVGRLFKRIEKTIG